MIRVSVHVLESRATITFSDIPMDGNRRSDRLSGDSLHLERERPKQATGLDIQGDRILPDSQLPIPPIPVLSLDHLPILHWPPFQYPPLRYSINPSLHHPNSSPPQFFTTPSSFFFPQLSSPSSILSLVSKRHRFRLRSFVFSERGLPFDQSRSKGERRRRLESRRRRNPDKTHQRSTASARVRKCSLSSWRSDTPPFPHSLSPPPQLSTTPSLRPLRSAGG
jgi:hypothetical protein